MCLLKASDSEEKIKKIKSRKAIKVYKVLRVCKNGALYSPYVNVKWTMMSEKTSSRARSKNPLEMTQKEKYTERISQGLHFFITKREALAELNYQRHVRYSNGRKCRKFGLFEATVKPKDIIAFGNDHNVVAHKATIIKKVKE